MSDDLISGNGISSVQSLSAETPSTPESAPPLEEPSLENAGGAQQGAAKPGDEGLYGELPPGAASDPPSAPDTAELASQGAPPGHGIRNIVQNWLS